MNITSVRIRPFENEGKTKALATVVINDEIAISRVRIVEGRHGLFVAFPAQKGADGEYHDIAYPVSSEGRKMLNREVLNAYDRVVNKEKGMESMFENGYEFKIVPGQEQMQASVPKQEPPHCVGTAEAHVPVETGREMPAGEMEDGQSPPETSEKGPPMDEPVFKDVKEYDPSKISPFAEIEPVKGNLDRIPEADSRPRNSIRSQLAEAEKECASHPAKAVKEAISLG